MAQRIATLLASATEIVYGLGLGDRVVAVSHECDYPAEVSSKPRATHANIAAEATSAQIDAEVKSATASGEPLYTIDERLLTELAPELIVTQAQCDVCAVRFEDVQNLVGRTPELAETTIVALEPNSIADLFSDVRTVARAADCEQRAAAYIDKLQARVDLVVTKTQSLPHDERPRVAIIEWTDPLMLAGNWMPELIELAGGRHDLTKAGAHSPYAKWEEVVGYDPQVIIIAPCGFDLARTLEESDTLAQLPDWDKLSAVRDRRVFAVDGNAYFNRSGPRLVDSLEIVAHLLHPSLFPPPACVSEPAAVWRAMR